MYDGVTTESGPLAGGAPQYGEVDQALFAALRAVVGAGRAYWKLRSLPLTVASPASTTAGTDEEARWQVQVEDELKQHSIDHSYHEAAMPEAVVYPSNTSQVAAIVALCHEHRIPITGKRYHLGLPGVTALTRVVVRPGSGWSTHRP